MSSPDSRRIVRRTVAIGALALLAAAGAVTLGYVSADLQRQASEFWMSTNGQPPDAAESRRGEELSTLSYSLTTFVAPLLLASILAALAILVVLTVAWDRRTQGVDPHREAQAPGDKPADAS